MPDTVLILGNYQQTITVIRSLARAGYRILVGGDQRKSFVEVSRFTSEVWCHPDTSRKAEFLSALAELLRRRSDVRYVFPVGELELELLSEAHDEVSELALPIMAAPATVRLCLDKPRTYELASQLGIPLPETRIAADVNELRELAPVLGPPLVVKRPNSFRLVLGEKALSCSNPEELVSCLANLERESGAFVLQRWVSGHRHNCHFAALDGRIVAFFEQKVLRTDRSNGTGFGVESVSVAPMNELRRYCEDLICHLRYTGPGCAQFLFDDRTSRAWFLELNPRLDATCELPFRCGVDFPRISLLCAVRSEAAAIEALKQTSGYPEGKRLHWPFGDLRGMGRLAANGRAPRGELLQWFKQFARASWKADFSLTWSWRDPLPTFFLYREAGGAFLRRLMGRTRGAAIKPRFGEGLPLGKEH